MPLHCAEAILGSLAVSHRDGRRVFPGLRGAIVVAAFHALVSVLRFALAAASQQQGGAVLITVANRETPVPGQPTGTRGALAGETLS
jgi:hypothetical protein